MATKRPYSTYSLWAIAAIAGGVVLTAIEVVGAVGYLVSQNQPSYLVAGGAVVTAVAAGLLPLAERCWRRGRYLMAAMLVAALVPALSVIFTAAVERTGGAKDAADRDRQAIALRIGLARTAEKEAKAAAKAAEAKAADECSRATNPKANPRGPLCKAAEERAATKAKALEAAREKLAAAGVVPRDPMAARLAAVLPVSEEAIALYQPLVLPLAISALGLILIAVGAHSPKPRKGLKAKGKRKRKGRPKPKPPASKPLPATVIPMRRQKP
jgi:hypothetical protein